MESVYRYIHSWTHEEYNLVIYTFPMVHIGEKRYYQEINKMINELNHVLLEGCSIKKSSRDLGKYNIVAKALGLSTQDSEIHFPEDINIINIDIDDNNLNEGIKEISLREKLFLKSYDKKMKKISKIENLKELVKRILSYPFGSDYALINPKKHYYFKNREKDKLDLIIQNDRDEIFQKKLTEYINDNKDRKYRFDIGIMLGSSHMPAVYRVLEKFNFKWELNKKIIVIE